MKGEDLNDNIQVGDEVSIDTQYKCTVPENTPK